MYPHRMEAYARNEPTAMADPAISSGSSSSPMGARMTDLPRKVARATTMSRTRIGMIMTLVTGRRRTSPQVTATQPSATAIILVEDLKT